MKIYPSKHRVYFRKQATPEMIPLSYAYNGENNRNVTIQVKDEFSAPYLKYQAQPHQLFESDQVFLFDKNEFPIENSDTYFQSVGAKWRLLPEKVTEFVPKTFDFAITIQRDALYGKEYQYKINIGFEFENQTIIDKLFSLIQGTKQARQYPSNIIFNNGESIQGAFLNLSESECDFLFLSLTELEERAHDNGRTVQEEIDALLSAHINIWIVDDAFDGTLFETDSDESYGYYRLAYNDIYASDSGTLRYYKSGDNFIRFRAGRRWSKLSPDLDREVPFFASGAPLQIFHRSGAGYIVLSHTAFFSKIDTELDEKAQVRLFFETILYAYLHGYHVSKRNRVFITDEPIDYFINTSQHYMLSHARMNLDQLLQADEYNIQIPYRIDNVEIVIPDKETGNYEVEYVGTNRFNDLIFKKISKQTKDPAKGNNLLVYTVDKTLMICEPRNVDVFVIESGVNIRLVDQYTLAIMPVLSTTHRIFTTREERVSLDKIETSLLCYDRSSYYNWTAAPFILLSETDYSNSVRKDDFIVIATISVSVNMDIDYKDIRVLGGGEASVIPNYEMIDTGNLRGRPYRYGCPMIIEIPYRFRPMKDEIRSEIEKHMVSGEYPIILYKD